MKWNPTKLPRSKRLTPEQLSSLPPLAEMKLENKILRAMPSSPMQKELKQQLEEMREARRQKESETMEKSNDAYQPVNNRTLADINRANTRANDSTVPEQSMMDAETGATIYIHAGSGYESEINGKMTRVKAPTEIKGTLERVYGNSYLVLLPNGERAMVRKDLATRDAEMNQAEGKNRHGQTKAEVEAELKKFRAMPSTRERRHRIEYLEKMLTSEYTSDAPAKDGGPGSGPQEGGGSKESEGNRKFSNKAYAEISKLTGRGYKVSSKTAQGAAIYKHPKEKGSVIVTPEGHVLANE